jgi:hypothetical protein
MLLQIVCGLKAFFRKKICFNKPKSLTKLTLDQIKLTTINLQRTSGRFTHSYGSDNQQIILWLMPLKKMT